MIHSSHHSSHHSLFQNTLSLSVDHKTDPALKQDLDRIEKKLQLDAVLGATP